MIVVLGIDPGTIKTGYGVVLIKKNQIECRDYGIIAPPVKMKFIKRIKYIHDALEMLYKIHKPHHTAIEKIFFGKNPQVAFKLGHVFASCLLQSQKYESLFFEYASRFVKKSTTFSGRASKDLVRNFVNNKLHISEQKSLDATDALAVALCHAQEWKKSQIKGHGQGAFLEVKL